MFSPVVLLPISYAIAGLLAQWRLPALFLSAGTVLTITSALAMMAKGAREID